MKPRLGAKTFIVLLAAFYFLFWAKLDFSTSTATLVAIIVLSSGLTVLTYAIASVLGFTKPLSETFKKFFS